MQDLRSLIADAQERKVAVGHFNVSDSEQLRGIFSAAQELAVPVIIGVSEGEREFFGVRQIAALVRSLREEHDFPVFLNADHTYSVEGVKKAVDAGFDAVIFDGAKLSLAENIEQMKQCVAYARSANPAILVEGELGYIGGSSKILDEVPSGAAITDELLTNAAEAQQFVEATGVDLLAPAVGNLHGMLKSGKNPNLNIGRISEIRQAAGVPLVLHGGSGISDEDFRAAITAGTTIVHINTEIRLAYRKGIQIALQDDREEIAPYRFMKGGVKAVHDVAHARLKLFNGVA
jgi:fructose-bisphosphate aldolase class II